MALQKTNSFCLISLLAKGLVFVLILALVPFMRLSAQSYELRINKITDEKGEDPGATFSIVEDSIGFIWFGTVDGLYRYDGFDYKVYRNEKNNLNSLAWNTIRAMCIGADNKLWIGTQGAGLDCFDLTNETFHHYSHSSSKPNGITGTDIWALTTDHLGNIWIGVVGNGVDMLNPATNEFTHYPIFPKGITVNEKVTIRALYEDSRGNIWIGMTKYGLSVLNPATGDLKNYQYKTKDDKNILSDEIRTIFEDKQGKLWVLCYGGGLNVYDPVSDKFIPYSNENKEIRENVSKFVTAGIEVNSKELWIGTEYGLVILNPQNNVFVNYRYNQNIRNSLSDDRIRFIYKDKNNIVWIGNESGVDKIVKQRNFKLFTNIPGDLNTINPGIVRSIFEDEKRDLWIGVVDQGLMKYDLRTNKIKRFIHQPGDPTSISGNRITSIFKDSQGTLWFGEWNTGLNRFNSKTETFELVAGKKPGVSQLTDTRIQFIKEAKPGILWIGTENGLNRFDTRNRTCVYYLHDERNMNSISGNLVQTNAFIQDSAGNLWIGTWSDGLNYVEFKDSLQQNAVYRHLKYNPEQLNGINNNNVISLYLDSHNVLWIGTFGGGLNRYDLNTRVFKQYTTENGLPNNEIFAILEDNDHNLWLSTDRGLSKFDPIEETFQNYSKSDGLQDDHFFWGASFKSTDGELFFGGINGLNSFYPDKIELNQIVPIPVITDIKIFEKPYISNVPFWKMDKLKLSYNQNYLTIEYAALNYSKPDETLYKIRMDGLDNNWYGNGNRRVVAYSNLSPGNYTFRLKVANSDGVWSNKEQTLSVRITPPWWKTWLARSVFLVLLIGSILGFYFIRVDILRSQNQKLEEQVLLRTQEIQNQTEELQAINEDLSSQKEELSKALDKLKAAQNQLIESEKMASLGILTAGVAHEINNPLNFIQGGVFGIESVLEDNPDCSKQCDAHKEITTLLDRIKTGIMRVSGIVTSLNHFNRQTDSLDQDCDIHAIIENCLLILNNQIKYKVEIIRNLMNDNPFIKGNEGKLHQLFLNILINSIHAIEKEGKIEIATQTENGYLEIKIKDTGSGISKENMAKIFDPFYTTKEVGKGTGLGLFIAYGIIKEHKGNIEFNSTEGKGTEAIIKLPIHQKT